MPDTCDLKERCVWLTVSEGSVHGVAPKQTLHGGWEGEKAAQHIDQEAEEGTELGTRPHPSRSHPGTTSNQALLLDVRLSGDSADLSQNKAPTKYLTATSKQGRSGRPPGLQPALGSLAPGLRALMAVLS